MARGLATSTDPDHVHNAGHDPCKPGQHAQPRGARRGLCEHFAAGQLWGRSILLATSASASALPFQLLQDTVEQQSQLQTETLPVKPPESKCSEQNQPPARSTPSQILPLISGSSTSLPPIQLLVFQLTWQY